MRVKPVAAVLSGLLSVAAATAFAQTTIPPTTPLGFDPDGSGGGLNSITVQTFDWVVSSSLLRPGSGSPNKIPIEDFSTPSSFRVLTHGGLVTFLNADGNPVPAVSGLNEDFEITFVAGACVLATPSEAISVGGVTSARVLGLELDPACSTDDTGNAIAGAQFFEVWYDDLKDEIGSAYNALSGEGYRDGRLILRGVPVTLTGSTAVTGISLEALDQFIANDWMGTSTVVTEGSQAINVLVTEIDKSFYTSGVGAGSLMPFTTEVRLPFRQTNPSRNFYTALTAPPPIGGVATSLTPDVSANVGVVNAASGPELLSQVDASNAYVYIPPALSCRVTGGGNDTAGIAPEGGWDGTMALDSQMSAPITTVKGRKESITVSAFVYTFGGQAGANTGQQPQPKGQWEHQNHDGPNGLQFNFKIGTASAPKGTVVEEIACTDEGWCKQARPAPTKQIDFVGTGSFTSIANNTDAAIDSLHTFPGLKDVVPVPSGKRDKNAVPTYHWFQVHIEDLGEPGSQENEAGATCPPKGSGNDPFASPPVIDKIADCGCADFYRIRIYKGFTPVLDENDNIVNTSDINKTDLIYEVWGYIDGGNFQIHPPTGFDLK